MVREPLSVLLPLYHEHGPIFTLRILHTPLVFMLGPAANRFITVEHPEHFSWREGSFGDLIPLLGDGLLTTDGAFHDRARGIMMPAFHHHGIEQAVATICREAERGMAGWRDGETLDLYEWMRNRALRIAMLALLGLDPDRAGNGPLAAKHFELALSFYGIDFHRRLLRGPGSPFHRMRRSRHVLDRILYAEIERRRAVGTSGRDILSLLIEARDEEGAGLTDIEIRDQLITLLFAGHDTSTSTLTFLIYELARHPEAAGPVIAELDEAFDEGPEGLSPGQLDGKSLPLLEQALEETLRLYPPAWIGPRRTVSGFVFAGSPVSRGTYLAYSSWASHRLPDVFPDPERFDPGRFSPERRALIPKGAYIPFGAGRRICIGKRFGQTEVRAVAAKLLHRFRIELAAPEAPMNIRQMPTLSPTGGLPVTVYRR